MIARTLIAVSLASAAALASAPASAQDEAGDQVNMVIVYGDDECPASTEGQIVVCARQSENERFRIPENLRFSDNPENEAWAQRVERLEVVGEFGTLSCSPTGAGGFTGCTQEMIDAATADREGAANVRFGDLIEAARSERLSTIDVDASAEQERVEQIEREYLERLEAERAEPTPGESVDPSLPPVIDEVERAMPAEPSKDTPFDDNSEEFQPLGAQVPARSPQG